MCKRGRSDSQEDGEGEPLSDHPPSSPSAAPNAVPSNQEHYSDPQLALNQFGSVDGGAHEQGPKRGSDPGDVHIDVKADRPRRLSQPASSHTDRAEKAISLPSALIADLALAPTLINSNLRQPSDSYVASMWLLLVMCIVPASVALLWFVVVPLGNTYSPRFRDKALFIFFINPGTQCLTSYLIIQLFMATIDEHRPWRPVHHYIGIIIATYFAQLVIPGAIIAPSDNTPFQLLGLVALALTLVVTWCGLRLTPAYWLHDDVEVLRRSCRQYRKVLIVFFVMMTVLVVYIIGFDRLSRQIDVPLNENGDPWNEDQWEDLPQREKDAILATDPPMVPATDRSSGVEQGFLNVALAVVTFILKKFVLAYTDLFPLHVAMLMSSLWLENLVDLFITLAYPTVTQPGSTFVIIWLTRVAENLAYLVFQTDWWFNFRVWIKGKFKKSDRGVISEDLNPDDRGHSNQRPGYLRRQVQFLVWKLFSQVSSGIFFLTVIPALRAVPYNNQYYPYQSVKAAADLQNRPWWGQISNNYALRGLSNEQFTNAIIFDIASFASIAVSIYLVYRYVRWKHPAIFEQLDAQYLQHFKDATYITHVFTILCANVMLAVSAMSLPYRMYYI